MTPSGHAIVRADQTAHVAANSMTNAARFVPAICRTMNELSSTRARHRVGSMAPWLVQRVSPPRTPFRVGMRRPFDSGEIECEE